MVGVVWIVGIASSGDKPAEQVVSQTPQVQIKDIPYEIVDSWAIPNGGYGKVVVISPANSNEADLLILGEKLKSDTKSDRNAFIDIFSDRQAALLRDKVLADNSTKAESDLYDTHFIASYSRNANTGHHELTLHLGGVNDENWKEVAY